MAKCNSKISKSFIMKKRPECERKKYIKTLCHSESLYYVYIYIFSIYQSMYYCDLNNENFMYHSDVLFSGRLEKHDLRRKKDGERMKISLNIL